MGIHSYLGEMQVLSEILKNYVVILAFSPFSVLVETSEDI